MKGIKITRERDNPLFGRKEVVFEIVSESAPSRIEVGKIVSEKFSASPGRIKIRRISGKFGSKAFSADVFIYDSEEKKNKVEIMRKRDSLHIQGKEGAEAKAS
jgi:ribosomal protein S24E